MSNANSKVSLMRTFILLTMMFVVVRSAEWLCYRDSAHTDLPQNFLNQLNDILSSGYGNSPFLTEIFQDIYFAIYWFKNKHRLQCFDVQSLSLSCMER